MKDKLTVKCPGCGLWIELPGLHLLTVPKEYQCGYCFSVIELKIELKTQGRFSRELAPDFLKD